MAGSPGDYLVVEDRTKPSTWHLPVKRGGKPNRALAAAAWAALHSNYRGNPYAGPQKAEAIRKLSALYKSQGWPTPGSSSSNSRAPLDYLQAAGAANVAQFSGDGVRMAEFALDPSDLDERVPFALDETMVVRRGKIFEAGGYDDKEFDVSISEMVAAIDAFEPVPIDIEHRPTLFDGKLGELYHVDVGDRLSDMVGWVTIPTWLNDLVGEGELKVSTTWSREPEKRITRLALTVDPRIEDATMLSAFSAASKSAANPAQVGAPHPGWSVRMGAPHPGWSVRMGEPYLAGPHDLFNKKETKRMTLIDKMRAALTGATPEELAEFAQEGDEPDKKAGPASAPDKIEPPEFARIRTLEAQVAQMAREKREAEATTFVDALIRDRRMMPAERASNIAELSRTMADDSDAPHEVTFARADGQTVKMSRTELHKANLLSRPQHDLFRDHSISELPRDSVLLHSSATPEKSEYEKGLEYGRKFVDENYPKNGR